MSQVQGSWVGGLHPGAADYAVAVAALDDLEPVERFVRIVADMELESG